MVIMGLFIRNREVYPNKRRCSDRIKPKAKLYIECVMEDRNHVYYT